MFILAVVSLVALPENCKNVISARPPIVSTVAGRAAGVSDGQTSGDHFVMPTGVAIRKDGAIVVADGAAQRIKLIKDGAVSTLAGSGETDKSGLYVPGGYVDGPAQTARFNEPSSIAVASNGDIYVADTNNNAIRLIRNGIVSTFIGGPEKRGPDLGNVQDITVDKVFAVAVDSEGSVYFGNGRGLRIADSSGKVTRFLDQVKQVYSVAVWGSGHNRSVFEVTDSGIDYYGGDGSERHIRADGFLEDSETRVAAADLIGRPTGITALGEFTAAFTDLVDGTVYVIDAREGNIEALAGSRVQSQSGDDALERDGSFGTARFNEPWGIAFDANRKLLIVSDAGGHRVRSAGELYLRGADYDESALIQASTNPYRIAYVGNSQAYFHTDFASSIEGLLEKRLTSASGRCVFVQPVFLFSDLNKYGSYLAAYSSVYDLFVVQLNGTHVEYTFDLQPGPLAPYDRSPLIASAPSWAPKLRTLLTHFNDVVRRGGARLLVVSHPYAYDAAPNEFLWNRVFISAGTPPLAPALPFQRAFHNAIAGAAVPYYDLYGDFENAELAGSCALFGPANEHLSSCGRVIVAQALSNLILQDRLISHP